MNKKNLRQIFDGYIDNFDLINSEKHHETYKWGICKQFPILMDEALSAPEDLFSKKLYDVKKCSYNIIDGYTIPFMGLVEFSKDEPETVRLMFKDLYTNDGGDLKIRMEKMSDFFDRADELLNKYSPGSHLYKQNSHSVSAYLFLYDPDHHYIYKATQCWDFADCVEFYDSWGMGDNIRLDVFHRMCDELISEIKQNEELLAIDASRFVREDNLHPDTEKHILAFDLIYCATVYNLYAKVKYTKRNAKEKNAYLANKEKAKKMKADYDRIKADYDCLREALELFAGMVSVSDIINHSSYGKGVVDSIDDRYVVATYDIGQKKISLPIGITKGLLMFDVPGFEQNVDKYSDILKKYESLPNSLDYASRALEPYEEYLD